MNFLTKAKNLILVFYYTYILRLTKIFTFDMGRFADHLSHKSSFCEKFKENFFCCELGSPKSYFGSLEEKLRPFRIDENRVCCVLEDFHFYSAGQNKVIVFAKVRPLKTDVGAILSELMKDPKFKLKFAPRMLKNPSGEYIGLITFDVVNPD